MNSLKKQARIAGLLYFILSITAIYGLLYVPSQTIVSGDAEATANRIMSSELLYRTGIVSNLISQTLFIFVVLALYNLFKEVNKKHAQLMVALVVVAVPMAILNILNEIAALILLSGADFLAVFEADQLHSLAYAFLRFNGQGYDVIQIFWGLWLFPFGLLAYKSRFVPRILSILLFIAGTGHLLGSFTALVLPQYEATLSPFVTLLMTGELPIVIWLLIKGVNVPKSNGRALASP